MSVSVEGRDGAGSVSAGAVHISPAIHAVPDVADLRHAERGRRVCAAVAIEHAAAGADNAERDHCLWKAPRRLARRRFGITGARTDAQRITHAFRRRVLSRAPTERGIAVSSSGCSSVSGRTLPRDGSMRSNWGRVGMKSLRHCPRVPPRRNSRLYTVVSRVLLNLDEAITRE
jgi:hypothetical protein